MLQQIIKPLHVPVMGVQTPTQHSETHVYMPTWSHSGPVTPAGGLLYKVYNVRDIIVQHHVHQSFTRSRGTGVNGPAKQLAREGERDKK